MKIVIDTNMVIAALIKDSKAREIITSGLFNFLSPDFVLEEIRKYEQYLCEKANITKDEFELLIALLFEYITIIPTSDHAHCNAQALELMKEDKKDAPYVACYFALHCDYIWTNDKDFQGKDQLKLITTSELLARILFEHGRKNG